MPAIALSMPHYGNVTFDAAEAYRIPTLNNVPVWRMANGGSILTSNFNRAWCAALNARKKAGITHFAMLHSDVCPAKGWLDVLLEEIERLDADVVSAVVPLKTPHGLTSTAIGGKSIYVQRRLSLAEIHELPETFSRPDVERRLGFFGPLLVNTGCFIADLRKPWVDQTDEMGRLVYAFRFENDIQRDPETGLYHSFVASEDWLFSRHLASVGASVYATRKVKLVHAGDARYANDMIWGEWQTDKAFQSALEGLARAGEKPDLATLSPAPAPVG